MRRLKKRLSLILLTGLVLLSLVLLGQSFGNKYANLTYLAWVWLIVLYIAPLVLLFKRPTSGKISGAIPLTALTSLFVLVSLLAILLQPFAVDSWANDTEGAHVTRIRTLMSSLYLLIPLELLILFLIRKYFKADTGLPTLPDTPTAFISYNHRDHDVAERIQQRLEAASIEVIIDHEDMQAGENIEKFIQDSILASTVTISLVSNASLSSGWVAMETIDTFFLERYLKHRKFVACYLEDDFFQDNYVIETVKMIDEQLETKLKHKAEQDLLNIDSRNLNNEITRLRKLRNEIDQIVSKLKSSLCLDVREPTFDQNMQRLIEMIKSED
ncbi:MAG: toll/interleukin-1 receptor domain-containing protein [Bacteroidota bacterium]